MSITFAYSIGNLSGQLYSTLAQLTRFAPVLRMISLILFNEPLTRPSSSPNMIIYSPLAWESANSQLSLMERTASGRKYLTLSLLKYSLISPAWSKLAGSELSEMISSNDPNSWLRTVRIVYFKVSYLFRVGMMILKKG